jgi:predicted GH43/DUF377 family glycosyl hydrolase
MVSVIRSPHRIEGDPTRRVLRPFVPGTTNFGADQERVERMVQRVLQLPGERRKLILAALRSRHASDFPDLEASWLRHLEMVRSWVPALSKLPEPATQLLVGAVLTQVYAYEAAALTNPSIVPIDVTTSDRQAFVMSARAVGEGHISSIAFITGYVDGDGDVTLESRHPQVSNGDRQAPKYSNVAFSQKLVELGFLTPAAQTILDLLPPQFTEAELTLALGRAQDSDLDALTVEDAVKRMHWVAASNYEVHFDSSLPISEHVLSPAAPAESNGIEDARFVRFRDDDGSTTYYATYTAYDGTRILPQLVETTDFHTFRMATMTGPAVHHKGMALFPRRIHGQYVALSRHDHERSFVLRSDSVRSWTNAEVVFGPEAEWDIVQTGNCGSPIETEAGWLVITHGVGPMRSYVLGAVLLDLDEPAKVVARLHESLLEPEDEERFGYVPDVVYSCGSLLHAGHIITPYGYADTGIKIAITKLDELLGEMS